jgi:2-phosphoxylose phosphatase
MARKLRSVGPTKLPQTASYEPDLPLPSYFDNLSAKLCHRKPLPCSISNREACITQELVTPFPVTFTSTALMDTKADQVFEQGHWEYGYLFRSAPGAFEYASLKFGAWVLELQSRLRAKISGSNKVGDFFSSLSRAKGRL